MRRQGNSEPDAQDLTQEFFARLLEKNWIAHADQSRGRFRSFLLLVLKRFLAVEWHKANALQPYAALAAKLEMSEGAVKVAVHRLRERYRARLKAEIAHTVASPADVDSEMRHLFRVLTSN